MVYAKEKPEIQRGLDESRKTEWIKWLDFGTTVKVQGDTLRELMDEGHKPIPTQWIETDQNEHLARPRKATYSKAEVPVGWLWSS